MNENSNNKNTNKQAYKKKYYPKKKWNNHNNKKKNDSLNEQEEEFLQDEIQEVNNDLNQSESRDENTDFRDENTDFRGENIESRGENIEVNDEVKPVSTDILQSKKVIKKEIEDEKEDFNKPEDIDQEFLKIEWPLHDSMKKELTTDFHRGCRIKAENYAVGSKVLRHSQCKLDSFNWLKDYQEISYEGEVLVAEIRFKNDRKDFYSYPSELELIEGELVAVETAIGHDIGIVTMVGALVEKQRKRKGSNCPVEELKKVYRRARVADVEKFLEATRQEERTLYRSREIALGLNLEMKLNDIEYQGDKTKAIFYYTADGRVDFRELIKKLAEEFHIRVEMRQIGFRQESAKLGGIGSCGRELCCSSWITNFQSVTTGVARIQQLSPNPQKLAGQCGKLKCCLNYEYDTYVDALKSFPDSHINLKTKKGEAFYQKSDVFKGLMWYSYTFDKTSSMAIPAEQVKAIIEMNKNGKFPEQLEDFAFIKEQHNTEYGEDGQYVDLSKLE